MPFRCRYHPSRITPVAMGKGRFTVKYHSIFGSISIPMTLHGIKAELVLPGGTGAVIFRALRTPDFPWKGSNATFGTLKRGPGEPKGALGASSERPMVRTRMTRIPRSPRSERREARQRHLADRIGRDLGPKGTPLRRLCRPRILADRLRIRPAALPGDGSRKIRFFDPARL
jgi:hypothetical protein